MFCSGSSSALIAPDINPELRAMFIIVRLLSDIVLFHPRNGNSLVLAVSVNISVFTGVSLVAEHTKC